MHPSFEQVMVLKKLMDHEANWHQTNLSGISDELTPLEHARMHFTKLYNQLKIAKLAAEQA